MLYIIPTPIGNLADWTFRAIEVIKTCDYLLCEDTRKTSILLHHYSLKTPLRSYHAFNERKEIEKIVVDLEQGKTIGLVSDAGTPLICDPGSKLLETLKEKKLSYSALPGPCAFVTALSELPTSYEKMQFIGFLGEKRQLRRAQMLDMLTYGGVSGFYVSPHDVISYIEEIRDLDPAATLYVFRELTKFYEELLSGSPEDLLSHFSTNPPKGEFVVFLKGTKKQTSLIFTPEEILRILTQDYNMKPSDAAKLASQLTGASRKELYKGHSC